MTSPSRDGVRGAEVGLCRFECTRTAQVEAYLLLFEFVFARGCQKIGMKGVTSDEDAALLKCRMGLQV